MNANVVEIQGLDRRFGKKMALEAIDLSVAKGVVLGLLKAQTALLVALAYRPDLLLLDEP
jgi:ABC-type Fe3+/spermidine/putrescine transport system ATPase subunit